VTTDSNNIVTWRVLIRWLSPLRRRRPHLPLVRRQPENNSRPMRGPCCSNPGYAY